MINMMWTNRSPEEMRSKNDEVVKKRISIHHSCKPK